MPKEINLDSKRVNLSQIREDLNSGLTRWKKDDIGFGSIEKKYSLLLQEAVELFAHPKIRNIETRIPTFIIVDDIPDEEEKKELDDQQVKTAKIEVSRSQTCKIVREEETERIVAFI